MRDTDMLTIRPATHADTDGIWGMLEPVIRAGETYALPRDFSREDALAYWLATDKHTFVALEGGALLGTYYMRANQMGGGSHVANCGYVTSVEARGRGAAATMCEHSQDVARRNGFTAMQFNLVVATNTGAVTLWQRLGFEIVGTLPGAFAHPTLGHVDAHIMFKTL
ncbi:MAG: GNAT family N-acetyltransferase [Pseudomonadota bacterium]